MCWGPIRGLYKRVRGPIIGVYNIQAVYMCARPHPPLMATTAPGAPLLHTCVCVELKCKRQEMLQRTEGITTESWTITRMSERLVSNDVYVHCTMYNVHQVIKFVSSDWSCSPQAFAFCLCQIRITITVQLKLKVA